MSTHFSVAPDGLEALTARMSGFAGFIRDVLDEFDRRVAAMPGEDWEGPAAQSYLDAHREWTEAASQFVDHVRRIESITRTAHTAYTSSADTNAAMLRAPS